MKSLKTTEISLNDVYLAKRHKPGTIGKQTFQPCRLVSLTPKTHARGHKVYEVEFLDTGQRKIVATEGDEFLFVGTPSLKVMPKNWPERELDKVRIELRKQLKKANTLKKIVLSSKRK